MSVQSYLCIGVRSPVSCMGYGGGLVAKSCPTLSTIWTVAPQASLSVGFSRQEYWSGLPFPSPCMNYGSLSTVMVPYTIRKNTAGVFGLNRGQLTHPNPHPPQLYSFTKTQLNQSCLSKAFCSPQTTRDDPAQLHQKLRCRADMTPTEYYCHDISVGQSHPQDCTRRRVEKRDIRISC